MSANNTRGNFFGYPEDCGWWCRRGIDLANAAVGFILGGPVGALSSIALSASQRISFTNIQLLPEEEEILNNWYDKYEIFYKDLLLRSDKYVSLNTFDKNNLLEVNEILQQITLVINFYSNDPENILLREEVVNERQNFIEKYLSIIKNTLDLYVFRVMPTNIAKKTVEFKYTILEPIVPVQIIAKYKVDLFYDKTLPSDIKDIIPIDKPPIDTTGNNGTGTGNTNATLGNKNYIGWIVGAIVAYRIFK